MLLNCNWGGKMNNKILSFIKSVETTQDMINRNYNELIKIVNRYESEQNLNFKRDEPLITEYHMEFNRTLHNYLSSIYTLIQHTDILKNKMDDNKFKELFNKKLSALVNDDTYKFYRNLRTYCQHYNIPPTAAGVYLKSIETMDCYCQHFSFDIDELL